MPDVLIVGGGIAGLACASRLAAKGVEVEVLEARDHPGGHVHSEQVDGFLLERGPHTFLPSADDIFALAEESGLSGEIISSRAEAHKRFIVRRERLRPVFTGPLSFLVSRLLSLRGKLKLMGEPFRTRRRGQPGDTAAEFFERRFGPEAARVLAGAFISGVYAGNPRTLSAPAAFPLFWRFEQEAGSIIRGALRHRKRLRAERGRRSIRPRGLYSFRQGLGQLSAEVACGLGSRYRTSMRVVALSREGPRFAVRTDQESFQASHLVLATPPDQASRLLEGLDGELGGLIASVPMAPMAVVYLGYDRRAEGVPDGFGFLAPRNEGVRTLGILFPSRLFEGRAPESGDLFTAYIGGALDPGAMQLPDAELVSIARGDLERLTGFSNPPSFVRVARHAGAIPQFTLGHLERMAGIHARRKLLRGLHLAGNYLKGVGMKDAVASGFEAADAITGEAEDDGQ